MARILIVEDHEAVADTYAAALRGYDLHFAETANEAAALAARNKYDLVLMDLALRRSSGVTAALALRGLGYSGPIVGITGGLVPPDEASYAHARFAETMMKPVVPDVLRALVSRYVRET